MSFVLDLSTQAICPHAGTIQATPSQARVRINGQPVLLVSDLFTVAGCPFQVPVGAGTKPQPCVSVQWIVPATRVRVGGQPVLLQTSSGLCKSAEQIPQGPPNVLLTQVRVRGQ